MSLGKEIDCSASENCLLGVFHSGVFQEMKDTINTSFKDLQGAAPEVFATSSLGICYPLWSSKKYCQSTSGGWQSRTRWKTST